ncbi:MAG: hypothetical protein ACRELD_04150 [Longimicrobiales bacterium]
MNLAAGDWLAFDGVDLELVLSQLQVGARPRCPCCNQALEAQPSTRLRAMLPPSVDGYDLECRDCRRYHPCVYETSDRVRLTRLRRFATAVLRA